MGFKKYRGPVETVEQAMMAHAVVVIIRQGCFHKTREWAWRLWHRAPRTVTFPLKVPVRGFRCRSCRQSVKVVIRVTDAWD